MNIKSLTPTPEGWKLLDRYLELLAELNVYPTSLINRQQALALEKLVAEAVMTDTRTQSHPDSAKLTEEEYRILWERDSAALGKCINEISTLRAVREDLRAALVQAQEDAERWRKFMEIGWSSMYLSSDSSFDAYDPEGCQRIVDDAIAAEKGKP